MTTPRIEELKNYKEPTQLNGTNYYRLPVNKLEHIIAQAHQAGVRDAIDEIEDYEKRMSERHNRMIGTSAESSKPMLAYDIHSRLIATEHIKEALSALIKE